MLKHQLAALPLLLAFSGGCRVGATPPVSAQTQPASKTLRTEGRQLLDTCGQPFVARGMEQLVGSAFSADGTLVGLAAELVKTGANAVRLLPKLEEVEPEDIEALLQAFASRRVVVYISPGERSWFLREDVRAVLLRNQHGLILDAFQEPNYDDVPRWVREAKAAISQLRDAGYTCPFTVLSSSYGRDLTAALAYGQEIVDSDPLHNTIIGWQAYWGNSGLYQANHKLTLAEGVRRCAAASFPMQLGIDLYADPGDVMDYAQVMAEAERQGIGWLWWSFWNRWDSLGNNASLDGTAVHLTAAGRAVIHTNDHGIVRTAKKACFR